MAYLLFIFYLVSFSILLYVLSDRQYIRLHPGIAVSSFLLKVALGCLYGYIFLHYYHGDDTWKYHFQSQAETQLLKTDPLRFFSSLFDLNNETRYSSLFEPVGSFWKELEYVLLIKLIAIFNIFSGGEYYVNVILFSGLTFWGSYYFFRLFSRLFDGRDNITVAVLFFFVPMVFWTSGIRKDGLILLFMSVIFYQYFLFLKNGQWRKLVFIAFSLLMLFLVRSFLALSMLPVLLAWYIAEKRTSRVWLSFGIIYGICLVLFFLSARIGPVNFPQKITDRQQEFFRLSGGSRVQLDTLGTSPADYIYLLPQALNHVLVRPYPGEQTSPLILVSTLETWFLVLMFLLALAFPAKGFRIIFTHPCIVAILCYGISNYLLVGYTIPFLGAIVRYRIIFETLFLVLIAHSIDWKRITPSTYKNKL